MEYIYTDKDGNSTKFTDDMVRTAIDERNELRIQLDTQRDEYVKRWGQIVDIRSNVYDFFHSRYDSGEGEITCTVEDVNKLLKLIGSDKLKVLFTVNGTISFSIVDVEADSEEDAIDVVENWLSVSFDGEGSLEEWNVDVSDASQQ